MWRTRLRPSTQRVVEYEAMAVRALQSTHALPRNAPMRPGRRPGGRGRLIPRAQLQAVLYGSCGGTHPASRTGWSAPGRARGRAVMANPFLEAVASRFFHYQARVLCRTRAAGSGASTSGRRRQGRAKDLEILILRHQLRVAQPAAGPLKLRATTGSPRGGEPGSPTRLGPCVMPSLPRSPNCTRPRWPVRRSRRATSPVTRPSSPMPLRLHRAGPDHRAAGRDGSPAGRDRRSATGRAR